MKYWQWQRKLECFAWLEIRNKDNKCSNIPMFNCLIVSNEVKQQEWKNKEECFDLTYVRWKRVKMFNCMFQMKGNGGNKRRNVLNVSAWHEKQVNKCGFGVEVLTQRVHRSIERHWDRFVYSSQIVQTVFRCVTISNIYPGQLDGWSVCQLVTLSDVHCVCVFGIEINRRQRFCHWKVKERKERR